MFDTLLLCRIFYKFVAYEFVAMSTILRTILKGASLTGALFVFQACYGTPQALNTVDFEDDEVMVADTVSSDEVIAEEPLEDSDIRTRNL